jgi:putative tRNA adenosine deaminase-associated protein
VNIAVPIVFGAAARRRTCDDAPMTADESEADFAVAVSREEGRWEVTSLPPRAGVSLEMLVHALRQQPGEGGAIGLISVGDDFFIALRVNGPEVRVLVSDATAAEEWTLAAEALDALGEPVPGDEDDEGPVGDLHIFSDLGFDALELEAICDDVELYPDEMLTSIASRLGFADAFESAVDAATGR